MLKSALSSLDQMFFDNLISRGCRRAELNYPFLTRKERDIETGLDYFEARYYASTQGRFTSPDPLLSSGRSLQPQSWNRYRYFGNNPLNAVDPTGLDWWYKRGESQNTPEWFDKDPGEGYSRWTNHSSYVYQSGTSGKWWALASLLKALSFDSQEAASQAFDNFSPAVRRD